MAVYISGCTLIFIILQVATGSLESVRPMGVELLDTILDKVNLIFATTWLTMLHLENVKK